MSINLEDYQHTYKIVMKKLQAETEFSKVSKEDLLVCALALEQACKGDEVEAALEIASERINDCVCQYEAELFGRRVMVMSVDTVLQILADLETERSRK